MSKTRVALCSLALTALVWTCFSWPLPRYFGSGIPSSATNVEVGSVRRMYQGDHLQLLYSYWLFSDMMIGKTAFGRNPYEFDTGGDSVQRSLPVTDLPYAAVFAIPRLVLGRAAAWNFTAFFFLWLTYLFTWLWLRNYASSDLTAALAALVCVVMPYRWHVMLGGSPTGYAMIWVPILLWSVEGVVRRGSLASGCAAAIAALFAYWNDSHVFIFSMLLAPVWGVVVLVHHAPLEWRKFATWQRMALAALPAAAMLGVLVVLGSLKQSGLEQNMGASGRTWQDVALYSPEARGLFAWDAKGITSSIYIGYIVPLLFGLGLLVQLTGTVSRPRENWRRAAVMVLLGIGVAGIIVLALGTHGPREGKALVLARQYLSPYRLIRQPAKIYVLIPPLVAVLSLLGLESMLALCCRARIKFVLAVVVAALLLCEHKSHVHASVCLLDSEQGAYKAVADDARAAGQVPRLLVIPIWSSDSSWSSLYEHYVSLYRIRMLNGYKPTVSREYAEQVSSYYDTVNIGDLSDGQLADLQRRGVRYLIFHENAFPEQASPFAVAWTLKQLLDHPRLDRLAQAGSVWAFKIRPTPLRRESPVPGWNAFFASPNAGAEPENAPHTATTLKRESGTSNGHAISLDNEASRVTLAPCRLWNQPNPGLLIRARGNGELVVAMDYGGGSNRTIRLRPDSARWRWLEAPIDPTLGASVQPTFRVASGAVDLDLVVLTGGRRPWMEKGETWTIPAPLFFHAGYTEIENDSVRLRRETDPDGELFYGPRLPLSDGRYAFKLEFSSDAPEGTPLGRVNVKVGDAAFGPYPVLAGREAVGTFSTAQTNLPVRLAFDYDRVADMRIKHVAFTRTE